MNTTITLQINTKAILHILLSIVLVFGFFYASGTASAITGATVRVSLDSSATQVNNDSYVKGISKDGSKVLIYSTATNLVSGDTNAITDYFVKTPATGAIERVNVSDSEVQANGASEDTASLSRNGRYVVFDSYATNLVATDTNAKSDIFIRDLQNGTTEMVSISSSEVQANGHSYIGDDRAVSDDGRFVIFQSSATDLVSGDTNAKDDIFIRDRTLGTTTRINLGPSSTQGDEHSYGGKISCDGRYIAFDSYATNLVSGDTNGRVDVFTYDQLGAILSSISQSANASVSSTSITCDGEYITIGSGATNLVAGDTNAVNDIFVYQRSTNNITRASLADDESQGNDNSSGGLVTDDGKYVLFQSNSTNLVSGDTNAKTDIFLRDMSNNTTMRVSVDSSQNQANNMSANGHFVSADGTTSAYASLATNLVTGDTNAKWDVFTTQTGNSANTCVLF